MIKEMRHFVTQAAIGDRIKIHGEYCLADLPGILDAADLVVLPSPWDGLPLVLVEAMLRRVQFVATAAGDTPELGDGNLDIELTTPVWEDFWGGLIAMARKIRSGAIDPLRLRAWAETRYGYESVSQNGWLAFAGLNEFFKYHD